jgi:hypothetical protein
MPQQVRGIRKGWTMHRRDEPAMQQVAGQLLEQVRRTRKDRDVETGGR